MMRIGFAPPVAPAFNVKLAQTSKPHALLSDLPALKPLQADTVSLGANTPSAVGLRSGEQLRIAGVGVGGTSTRIQQFIVDGNDGLLPVGDLIKYDTPKTPQGFVEKLGEQLPQGTFFGFGFPGQINPETHTVELSVNLPQYQGSLLPVMLKDAQHLEITPPDGNDLYLHAKGLYQKGGSSKQVVALGTGTNQAFATSKGIVGAEIGHIPQEGRGLYPRRHTDTDYLTAEKLLCDLPELYSHTVQSIREHYSASSIHTKMIKPWKGRSFKEQPFTLEEIQALQNEKHPLTKMVVDESWLPSVADYTVTGLLAHKLPSKVDVLFGGGMVDALIRDYPERLISLGSLIQNNATVNKLYGTTMSVLTYASEKMEVLGAAKMALEKIRL
jgi:hypothetical protein